MRKKIAGILLVGIFLVAIVAIVFGEKALRKVGLPKYETARTADELLCRVYGDETVEDIKVQIVGKEAFLFLPSLAKSVEFVNLAEDSTVSVDEKNIVLPVKKGVAYDIDELKKLFDATESMQGKALTIMVSANLNTIFLCTEVSQEQLDEVLKAPYKVSLVMSVPTGKIVANDELEYIKTRGSTSFLSRKKSYEIRQYVMTSTL